MKLTRPVAAVRMLAATMILTLLGPVSHGEENGPGTKASQAAKEESKKKPPKLERCEVGSIRQIHRLGKVYLAGQPSQDDFRIAKKGGLKTVINLRTQPELTFDEAAHLKSLGIEYHHVPFRSPETLTDKVFDSVCKVLNEEKNHPVMVHCASANRVGAVWLAHRVLDADVKYEDALKEAEAVGLRTRAFEDRAKAYIEATMKKREAEKKKDKSKQK